MLDLFTLATLFRHVRAAIEAAGKPDAGLDARLIVEHATGVTRIELLADAERSVAPNHAAAALAMLERRLAGEPVFRIIGRRDFHGLTLELSKETLEPRPDTEALVDLALGFVRAVADRQGTCRILDLGTGTGAIALALLKEEPRATAVATDISADALATAARNADMSGHGARFETLLSDWFAGISDAFDVIVSNPPYIATAVVATLEREVRGYDPMAALDGGADGLDAYRAIATDAANHLVDGGVVAVEIGYDQAPSVKSVFGDAGFDLAGQANDLGNHARALVFTLPGRG